MISPLLRAFLFYMLGAPEFGLGHDGTERQNDGLGLLILHLSFQNLLRVTDGLRAIDTPISPLAVDC
jgi:hypothetical protein